MKLKIKVKVINEVCRPSISENGDWIDLRAAVGVDLKQPHANILHKTTQGKYRDVEFESQLVPLGIAMQLPKGFEGKVLPRSSSFKNYGFIETNSQGVIDNSYCGDNDEWKLPILAVRDVHIEQGQRIAQFRIELSQKATFWQKLKWLFSSGVKLKFVDNLDNPDRDGIGSTGKE